MLPCPPRDGDPAQVAAAMAVMAAYRHTFAGAMFEVHTSPRTDGRWAAEMFVVQEQSLLLQPYASRGDGYLIRQTESEAHQAAVSALEERFGPQRCKPSSIPEGDRYRIIGRARTA